MRRKIIGGLILAVMVVLIFGIHHHDESGKNRDPYASEANEDIPRTISESEEAEVAQEIPDSPDEQPAVDDDRSDMYVSETEDAEVTERDDAIAADFRIDGMDDTLLSFFGSDEILRDELQEQLYAYGYYDYSSAEILEYTYDEYSVDIALSVKANMEIDAEMIYSIDTDTWQLKIW